MAEKKLRIHTLAKELGVESKAIIDKCKAEDIDVKNHMHVVSAGLEATIREWFSAGSHNTTLEEAQPVDLESVRLRAPRKRKAKAGEETGGIAVLESPPVSKPAEPVIEVEPALPAASQTVAPAAAAAAETTEEVELTAPSVSAESHPRTATPASVPAETEAAAPLPPAASSTAPKPAVAGPQNVPRPAELRGPRVIRIERPDNISRPPPRPARPVSRVPGPLPAEDEDERRARRGHAREGERSPLVDDGPPGLAADKKRAHPRRSVRDTRVLATEQLREWRDRDLIERRERLDHASGRGIGNLRAIEGKQTARRSGPRQAIQHVRKEKVLLAEPIIIKDFSRETGIPWMDVQRKLLQEFGQMVTINSALEPDTAQLIAAEHGIELEVTKARTGLDKLADEFAALPRANPESRPPVVTVLGHVDHGKTSLLDRIRKANVAAGEAGGITQHIGAYRVHVGDRWVTFLDTPGHTAFTAMRARGTNMTDVVVLVVAADDGVMPTTIEAINHAKAAKTTIVVALNKIDLPHDINKIYGQLSEHGLTPSGDWGGETDVIKTSALTGQGIDDLLAHLATLSDVMTLIADPRIPARGTVIESQRKEGVGNVARLLVQEGTLSPGQFIVCGPAHGRVRALRDEHDQAVHKAGPSTPVEVTGLNNVPSAGDRFFVVESAQRAKEIAEEVAAGMREKALARAAKPTNLESMLASAAEGEIPELNVIVKADVQGSIDVLKKTLSDFPSDQVKLNILHDGVGTVTESDIVLAQASDAIIVAFHVVPEPVIQRMADDADVSIRTYRVIYNLLDDIKKALEDQLPPDEKIESRGRAEVREIFAVSKVGKVAGCFVREGTIARNHTVRVVRDGVVVKDKASIGSLRRFKDDVREVKSGFECGVSIEGFNDVKPGDVIEAYEVVKIARTLD